MTAPRLMVAAAQRVAGLDPAAPGAPLDLVRCAATMLCEAGIALEIGRQFRAADECNRASEALRAAADRINRQMQETT